MTNKMTSSVEDVLEYRTFSTQDSAFVQERPERLHEWLSKDDIEILHKKFLSAQNGFLSSPNLREFLERLHIVFTDFEWNRLYMKMNTKRNVTMEWDEFISYLIYGFQDDDPHLQKETLILPISTPPVVKKSEHRSAICAICLQYSKGGYSSEDEDESDLNGDDNVENTGMWLTASHEGNVRFWTTHLESLRSSSSESIHLKMPTWILAIQALSDVSIVVTSSTERELRFHETVAARFTLRLVIRALPAAVYCLAYRFHAKGKEHSRLVLGDYVGNVRILEFDPYLRGPFQSKPGTALIELFWTDIMKGKFALFKVKEYLNIHSEIITQVWYSMHMNAVFASAEYRNTRKYKGRCPGLVVSYVDSSSIFRIPLGVTTFYVDEKANIVITGGPDTFVRIWDVYISRKPIGILAGHNAGIVMVFNQSEEKKVYSIDYHKIIKVWHMTEYTLLQTYTDLACAIPTSEKDIVYHYYASARELVVGGRKFMSITCCPRIRVDLTDGNTHAGPVSVVLYNRLFRNLVTCGLDSYIIIWDPYTGRRRSMMKNCHTRMVYGEVIDVEITAACFDPLDQLLLTGARDGTLKIWNYNSCVCMRNMCIKPEQQVTAVLWVVERILAAGWDRQVTEFNDVEGREYGDPKKWPTFHSDDITCSDLKSGEGVVTATYSGEIIFWKLETGQPYRRYSVIHPRRFIELKYNNTEKKHTEKIKTRHISISSHVRKSISTKIKNLEQQYRVSNSPRAGPILQDDPNEINDLAEQRKLQYQIPKSVQAVLFLQTRPMTPHHGSVLVALDNGVIQVYSHHQRGGYIKEFFAVHRTGDCVLAMSTDRKNRYLFTGTAFGYVKVWHIINFCIPEEEKVKVSMPMLRLQFIFLSPERFLVRAKRRVKDQLEPLQLNSYKAHLKAINSLEYINKPHILITGSQDCSCRLWSLGGRYLGTLGSPLAWTKLSPFEPIDELSRTRMPPDIQKVASSTTMKVISGIQPQISKNAFKQMIGEEVHNEDLELLEQYFEPMREPLLGKHFKIPGKAASERNIQLEIKGAYIPAFIHLDVTNVSNIECPQTSPIINKVKHENYMDLYIPPNVKDEEESDPFNFKPPKKNREDKGVKLILPQERHNKKK